MDDGPRNKVSYCLEIPGIELDYGFKVEAFTLRDLIAYLEAHPLDKVFDRGICNAHSYRGNYYDLAFEPGKNIKVRQMLELANLCANREFEGYKGGWFTMGAYTSVYLAFYGHSYGITLSELVMEGMRIYDQL